MAVQRDLEAGVCSNPDSVSSREAVAGPDVSYLKRIFSVWHPKFLHLEIVYFIVDYGDPVCLDMPVSRHFSGLWVAEGTP